MEVSQADIKHIFTYMAEFYDNCGNFNSFGDLKFVPRVSKDLILKCI